MKILLISNMFPPFIMGGAEMAAHSLATWLAGEGHSVHVLTSAHKKALSGIEIVGKNLTVERHFFPGPYQIYQAESPNAILKTAWHVNDHFNLSAERITGEVLQRVKPDIVNTHSLQGIGYNLLRAIARSGLPCVQTLHDFGFQCINVNRFRDGKECDRHHLTCQFSTRVKRSYLEGIERLSFWSPSEALLGPFRAHLPSHARARAIPLPLIFQMPAPAAKRPDPSKAIIRFLYVGQVTPWKGVDFLLGVISQLPKEVPFVMEIIGGGSDLEMLREKFKHDARIVFHGKLPPENVGEHMATADLLLTPSLWFENAPLVISQAIQMGLPVLASRIGGLPELVDDGLSGRLIAPGDALSWSLALGQILENPAVLQTWIIGAQSLRERFSTELLGRRVVALFAETMGGRPAPPLPHLVPC